MTLKITVFGRLQVVDGDLPISRKLRPRAKLLLAFLLINRQKQLSRTESAFLLWPDEPEKKALGNLRRALSDLRTTLPKPPVVDWIQVSPQVIGWNQETPYRLDLEEFDQLSYQAVPSALHDAIALYTADLLLDIDAGWVVVERERVRRAQLNMLRQLVAHHRALGEVETALKLAQQVLSVDPISESAYQDLMAIRYESGDRAAALVEYNHLRNMLQVEVGAEPMPETEALHKAILHGTPLPQVEDALGTRAARPPEIQAIVQLFGRQEEMAQLMELWGRVLSANGRLAVVNGEAGVGKSHLAHGLAEAITGQGGLVLVGHCFEFERSLPYQAIVEMLLGAKNVLSLADLAAAHRSALAQLVPDLLGVTGGSPVEFGTSTSELRQQLFEAMLQAFLSLSRSQPLLMVIEDAHWAAESTLDWLTYIAPRISVDRLLVLITFRTHEVDKGHALSRLERRFARQGIVSTISLETLDLEAYRALVADLSGLETDQVNAVADRLFQETGGNPFFLHEVVRELFQRKQITIDDGRWAGALVERASGAEIRVPDSLRATINARVEQLTELSRMFVRTAAVAGRVFQFGVVQGAGGWVEGQALEAIEDLLERGFVSSREKESDFVFVHHLVQEAIYADLTPPRRAYLHRQIAGELQRQRPDDYEALAHHFIAAGQDRQSIDYSIQAARRAQSIYAYDEAVEHLDAALKLLEKGNQNEERLPLLEEQADSFRLLRKSALAVAKYQSAIELWGSVDSTDIVTAVRLYRKILQTTAGMWGHTGYQQFEAASEIIAGLRSKIEAMLQLVEGQTPHPESVRLLKALANDAMVIRDPPDWDAALHYAQSAVTMAEALDTPDDLSSALATLSSVYGARGMLRERVDVSFRRLALIEDPKFDNQRERSRVMIGLGSALVHVGEYHRAIPHLQEAENMANEIEAIDLVSYALSLLQQCWFRLDRWQEMDRNDEKRNKLRQQYSLERLGSPCFSIALSSAVYALRGEIERAERLRQESLRIMFGAGGEPENWRRSQHY
jgi:DNA-binding SARP family transcriptional activator